MEAAAEAPREKHSHRLLWSLAAVSLLLNAAVVAGLVAVFASESVRGRAAAALDLAGEDGLEAAEAGIAEAAATAARALEVSATKPWTGDLTEVQAGLSDLDLRLSAAERAVTDTVAEAEAACDWAALQLANFTGTSLEGIFTDYAQGVCGAA